MTEAPDERGKAKDGGEAELHDVGRRVAQDLFSWLRVPELARALGRALRFWVAHLAPILALTAVLYLPWIAVQVFTSSRDAAILLGWTSDAFLVGALSIGVASALAARPVRGGAMLTGAARRALPILSTAIAVVLGSGACMLVAALLAKRAESPEPTLLLGWVAISFVEAGFAMAIPAAALEGHGPLRSLRRSWELARGRKLGLCLLFLLLRLADRGATGVASGGAAPLSADVARFAWVAVVLFGGSLRAAIVAQLFHDLRGAREGRAEAELARIFD